MHALRPALERRRPPRERAHDAVVDREVVPDDVELADLGRALGAREDHAVGTRDAHLPVTGLDDRRVGLGHATELYRSSAPAHERHRPTACRYGALRASTAPPVARSASAMVSDDFGDHGSTPYIQLALAAGARAAGARPCGFDPRRAGGRRGRAPTARHVPAALPAPPPSIEDPRVRLDMRRRLLTVGSQEVLTSDSVQLRISVMVAFSVTDPARAVNASRATSTSCTWPRSSPCAPPRERGLDELIEAARSQRTPRRAVAAMAPDLGIRIESVRLRDVMLPRR